MLTPSSTLTLKNSNSFPPSSPTTAFPPSASAESETYEGETRPVSPFEARMMSEANWAPAAEGDERSMISEGENAVEGGGAAWAATDRKPSRAWRIRPLPWPRRPLRGADTSRRSASSRWKEKGELTETDHLHRTGFS